MPKYLTKLSKFGGQYRITIPRLAMAEVGWEEVEYVLVGVVHGEYLTIRRFIDGESLKSSGETDSTGEA